MKRYYRKNRPSVALFLVSNLLAAGSSVFMSFLLGAFADSAMEGDLSRVWKIALVTLFYLCIETFFAFLLDYSRDIIVQRVGRDLRADAVRKIEALSYMEKKRKGRRLLPVPLCRMTWTPSSRITSRRWAKFIFRSAVSFWQSARPLLSSRS